MNQSRIYYLETEIASREGVGFFFNTFISKSKRNITKDNLLNGENLGPNLQTQL